MFSSVRWSSVCALFLEDKDIESVRVCLNTGPIKLREIQSAGAKSLARKSIKSYLTFKCVFIGPLEFCLRIGPGR